MQTLFDTCNVHAQGIYTMYIIISLLYTSGTQTVKECSIQKDACYSCYLLGSDLFSNVNKSLLEYTLGESKLTIMCAHRQSGSFFYICMELTQ